jgi:hypothetical protein
MDSTKEIRESRLRREAAFFGIRMLKSSGASSLDNHGGYKLVETSRNAWCSARGSMPAYTTLGTSW